MTELQVSNLHTNSTIVKIFNLPKLQVELTVHALVVQLVITCVDFVGTTNLPPKH